MCIHIMCIYIYIYVYIYIYIYIYRERERDYIGKTSFEHQIRGRKAVSAAGLQGRGSHKRSVCSIPFGDHPLTLERYRED